LPHENSRRQPHPQNCIVRDRQSLARTMRTHQASGYPKAVNCAHRPEITRRWPHQAIPKAAKRVHKPDVTRRQPIRLLAPPSG
jgi:hypothetical protein